MLLSLFLLRYNNYIIKKVINLNFSQHYVIQTTPHYSFVVGTIIIMPCELSYKIAIIIIITLLFIVMWEHVLKMFCAWFNFMNPSIMSCV